MIRVAINGFGRIGRTVFRKLVENSNIEVVAINDLTDAKTLAHLLKYDSIHKQFKGTVESTENEIVVNGKAIKLFAEREPEMLPWGALKIDVVIECTGKFNSLEKSSKHIASGAKKVLISAPASGGLKSVVLGVNDSILDGTETVISNASCTTNSAAPLIKVLDDNWEVESAFITTIHSYTGDQNLHDSPHKDLRRARAAALSIIPTSTGAAKAITEIFPKLKGHIGGAGIRVPVPNGSLTDITCVLKKPTTVEAINAAFKAASESSLKNILEYTEDPIVSVDIVGNAHSCIFDSGLTTVVGNLVKVVGWYDNEMGYSARLAELAQKVG